MTSPLILHAAPAAGFDQPFEMLAACHERIERMLGLLERLAAHLPAHGADVQARGAAHDVMRYFDLAAPRHHEDEERHVLPALRASGDGADAALAARLHADHEAMSLAWQALRPALAAIEQGRPPAAPTVTAAPTAPTASPAPFAASVAAFAAMYRAHLGLEDRQAFGVAAARIGGEARAAMGAEMAQRRGLR